MEEESFTLSRPADKRSAAERWQLERDSLQVSYPIYLCLLWLSSMAGAYHCVNLSVTPVLLLYRNSLLSPYLAIFVFVLLYQLPILSLLSLSLRLSVFVLAFIVYGAGARL